MKLYIIAGEASGDLHASDLIRELKILIPSLKVRAWGGDLMKAEGADIIKHFHELAFMGFMEVFLNLRTILGNINFCKKDILNYQPDAIILVDYPGFNLRIAEFANKNNFPVYYYISPQVWAWKSSRVKKIKKVIDKMFVILPFEKEFYKKFNFEVEYVGHPLTDVIKRKKTLFSSETVFKEKHGLSGKPIISILPGSRKQEIKKMLPIMLSVKESFPEYQFVVAAAPSVPFSFYNILIKDRNVALISGETYELLFHSKAALVTSGTATLEAALLNVPEVVCYKGGLISYLIAKSLVKIKFISLVNLILDREVVKELIQENFNSETLKAELIKILDPQLRLKIFNDYTYLNDKLNMGQAASKTAAMIVNDFKNRFQ